MNVLLRKFYVLIIFTFFLLSNADAFAQLFPSATEAKEAIAPEFSEDSLGRRTPRGTVSGYFQAVGNKNYQRASQFLNIKKSRRSDSQREKIVLNFQKLLDKSGNILPYSLINNTAAGKTDDELSQEVDYIGTMTVNGDNVKIYVENVSKSDEAPLWLFSSSIVAEIATAKVSDDSILDKFIPNYLKEKTLGGVPLGHWIAMLIMVFLSYYFAKVVFLLLIAILRIIWKKSATDPIAGVVKALALPFQIYLAVLVFVVFSKEIGISIIVRQKLSTITLIVGIIAFLILLWRLTDFIGSYSRRRMNVQGRVSAVSIILFLRRFIKIAIVVFGLITIFSTLGFDVTAGIAALGIGGIALALGAQKTVENFVGSVTLVVDQPIRVGDFCSVGGITGTVEQIGMRSTRLRTLNRTVVTIPNGEFSSSKIENFAPRDRFLMRSTFGLRYETTPDQMRFLLVEIRKLLYSHPMVNNDPARVRFINIGKSTLDLEVFVYIDAIDYDNFLEVQEDLLLRFMDTVKESGTDFAFPSQTLYFAKDSGTSEENTVATEERVADWRTKNEMQLPKFHEKKIMEIENTLDYPPKGSATANQPKI